MLQSAIEKQNKERIAKQFSIAATHYDNLAKVQLDIALDAKAMLSMQSQCLLDIGCGTGRVTQQLSTHSKQVLAMDLAFGMLQHASCHYSKSAKNPILWIQGDAEHLPLKNDSVDSVFSSMALQWCSEPERVMSELHRILIPKGQIVLAIMTAGSFNELKKSWACIDNYRHVNQFFSSQTWLKAAIKSGLQVEIKDQCYQTWHPNIRHLLTSVKGIGANTLLNKANESVSTASLSRHQLSKIEQFYFSQFGVDQQIPLSYQIAFLQCVKE
jgi:malonyl-CoA O-methyltransferase